MNVRPSRAIGPLLALTGLGFGAACARGDAADRPLATVDTLPSGVIRVHSDRPTGWADSSRAWKLVETLRIEGEDGTTSELVEPGAIGVDGFGRIYVVDRKPAIIKVFDSTGALVRTIGGEGSGPGEFRVAFLAVRGATVVVHDPQQSRTTVFDTTGAFVRSWVSSCCFWNDVAIDAADRIYIPTWIRPDSVGESRGNAYTRYRVDGTVIDTLFIPTRRKDTREWVFVSKGKDGKQQGMMSTTVPLTPRFASTFHPEGGFVAGWTGEFKLLRSPSGEDTTVIITRAWTPDPIPESTRRAEVESMVKNTKDMVGEATARTIARLEDVPTQAPAYTTLQVDLDGNVWVRRMIGSDSARTTFDVMGPDGAWLGRLVTPVAIQEWSGQFFGRGAIYAVAEGEDGRPAIIRLRVDR